MKIRLVVFGPCLIESSYNPPKPTSQLCESFHSLRLGYYGPKLDEPNYPENSIVLFLTNSNVPNLGLSHIF